MRDEELIGLVDFLELNECVEGAVVFACLFEFLFSSLVEFWSCIAIWSAGLATLILMAAVLGKWGPVSLRDLALRLTMFFSIWSVWRNLLGLLA